MLPFSAHSKRSTQPSQDIPRTGLDNNEIPKKGDRRNGHPTQKTAVRAGLRVHRRLNRDGNTSSITM